MHSYRKAEDGWQVYFQQSDDPVGPIFELENEAAAFASFMNGGRYSPGDVEYLFSQPASLIEEDDDSVHPDRPKEFDEDYPIDKRKRG